MHSVLTFEYIECPVGETSDSAMASITCFILKNPEVHRRLNEEVRSYFASHDGYDVAKTNKLEYVMAVLKEGMRIFQRPKASPGFHLVSQLRPLCLEV